MMLASAALLVKMVRRRRLLEWEHEELLPALARRFPKPRDLARELIRLDWLTPFQVNQLFLGREGDLVLGPYVLLERLGSGGMAQVFKARHRRLGRIVALKVIRPASGHHPNMLKRFQREIQAAAQLSHPHIILAFDAD